MEFIKDTVIYLTKEDNITFGDRNEDPNVTIGKTLGNRIIDMARCESIRKAMERGEPMPPILVNSKSANLIEGQHRLMAAMLLWAKGINYKLLVVCMEIDDEARFAKNLNSKQKPWSNREYINYNAIHEIPGYKDLDDFIEWMKEQDGKDHTGIAMTLFNSSLQKVKDEKPLMYNMDIAKNIFAILWALSSQIDSFSNGSVRAIHKVYTPDIDPLTFMDFLRDTDISNIGAPKFVSEWKDCYQYTIFRKYYQYYRSLGK